MDIDIEAERNKLQAIFDGPSRTEFEEAVFKDIIGKGSPPSAWDKPTISSAHYMIKVYEMGWGAAKDQGQHLAGCTIPTDRGNSSCAEITKLKADNERLRGLILRAIDRWWPFVHGAIDASDAAKNLFRDLTDGIQKKGT